MSLWRVDLCGSKIAWPFVTRAARGIEQEFCSALAREGAKLFERVITALVSEIHLGNTALFIGVPEEVTVTVVYWLATDITSNDRSINAASRLDYLNLCIVLPAVMSYAKYQTQERKTPQFRLRAVPSC